MFLLTIAAFFDSESCCSEYLDALIVFRVMWVPNWQQHFETWRLNETRSLKNGC